MVKFKILAVDDQKYILDATRYVLEPLDVEVDSTTDPQEAIQKFRKDTEAYALAIVDYNFNDSDVTGGMLVRQLKEINPEICCIIYSAVPNREALKECWAAGADGFIDKGVETVTQELRETVLSQCVKYRQTKQPFRFADDSPIEAGIISSIGMVGVSRALSDVAEQVKVYRERNEPVLIYGNTGTGKELVARALHGQSSKPFIVVNCAAYKDAHLLESELFGYEKGAFTGADKTKPGILEVAMDGTVFFDEIHQLSLTAQAKLLRVFQESKIRRMGSSREYSVRCRFVMAAKPILDEKLERKEFLEDFFYRIDKLRIAIPDLKDRPEDIEPLVDFFCRRFNKTEENPRSFRMTVVEKLKNYTWPGNVRELENTVTKLLANARSKYIELESLDPKFFVKGSRNLRWKDLEVRHAEEKRSLLLSALTRNHYKADAARQLGLTRSTLNTLEKTLQIYQPAKSRGLYAES